jgi:sugar phosphate permease
MTTAVAAEAAAKARLYPWVIAFTALFMLMISNGMTTTGITAFDEAILKEFGWKRGEFKFRDMITLLTAGLLAPFAGYLIDRIGVRTLMLVGSAALALLYFAYSRVSSLTELYLIHVGFGLVLVCAGLNVAVVMTSQWFVQARGTAIGIALVGSSLGGVVFPPLILSLLPAHGWRGGFAWLALAGVALFIVTLLVVRSPTAMGLSPLGAGKPTKGPARPPSPDDLTYQQAIRTVSFWALTFVAMASFYSILALALHLFLYMRGLGFDPKTAGGALGLLFGLGLLSKFLFGFLSDVLPPKAVFVANVGIMLVGLILMASQNRDLLWPGIAVTGFGWGGLYTLIQYQAVNNFGVSHTGKILGTITMLDAIAGGLGIWLTGVLFDRFKSYEVPFWVFVGLLGAALVASLLVKREVPDRRA